MIGMGDHMPAFLTREFRIKKPAKAKPAAEVVEETPAEDGAAQAS